jgi:hypothetical protein
MEAAADDDETAIWHVGYGVTGPMEDGTRSVDRNQFILGN